MDPEIWKVLDLAPVRDRDAIRRAYARRLKVTSPEDDPKGFQTLRAAYDEALAALDWDWAWEDDDEADGSDAPQGGFFEAKVGLAELNAILGRPLPSMPPAPEPAPPLPDDEAHALLIQALEGLVAAEPRAEPAALEAALAAVLASPATDNLTVAAQTERRIAHLIVHNAPRADALVRPAINAFRWTRDRVRIRQDGLEDAVLNRDADIIFRNGLMRDEGLRRTAFLALARPLDQGPAWHDRYWPGFGAAVRDLLTEIDNRRPSLVADLNAESLAHWRKRATRPRLPAGTLVVAGMASLWAGVIALFAPEASLSQAGGAFLICAVAVLAAALLWAFGVAPLRLWWRAEWAWRAPSWLGFGWAPASIALLPVAVLIPAGAAATVAVGLCAAVLAAWALVTAEIDTDPTPGAWPLPVKLLVSQGLLAAWWSYLATVLPEATPPAATLAFVGAAIASAVGAANLPMLWYRGLPRLVRLPLILGLAGATVWTALRVLDPHPATGDAALAAAVTAAVVLAHRPLAGGLGSNTLQWRYRIQAFPLVFVIGAAGRLGSLKVSCLWLLVGVAIALIGALWVEKDL